MAETGSASFYRRQAERLMAIAAETTDSATRLELLQIAVSFQKLAAYASAHRSLAEEEAPSESAE